VLSPVQEDTCGIHPQVSAVGFASARLEHLHRRLVGINDAVAEDAFLARQRPTKSHLHRPFGAECAPESGFPVHLKLHSFQIGHKPIGIVFA